MKLIGVRVVWNHSVPLYVGSSVSLKGVNPDLGRPGYTGIYKRLGGVFVYKSCSKERNYCRGFE